MVLRISDILKYSKGLNLLKEVEIILCDYLDIDSAGLFLRKEERLSAEVENALNVDIKKLRNGYPLAYIRKKADFYGLEFIVNEHVLIPRKETEILVEKSIECIKKLFNICNGKKQVKMIEVGVGSGCISICIANEFNRLQSVSGHRFNADLSHRLVILGLEKSKEVLRVARKNVVLHCVVDTVTLKKSDLLEKATKPCDILVANLPYIAPDDPNVQASVRKYEPHVALFANEGGLALYRRLFKQLHGENISPPFILLEIGYDQGARIKKLCCRLLPEYDFTLFKDLEGRDRVVKLVK